MNDKKTIIIGAVAVIALIVAMVGVGGNDQSSLISQINKVDTKVDKLTNAVGEAIGQLSEPLGGSRFPNGISADSTSPSAGQVRGTTMTATGSATVGDDLSVTDTFTVSGYTDVSEFTQGGGCTASSTVAAAETWTESFMESANCFEYSGQATAAAISITLPATSTMDTLIPNAGDMRTWIYDGSAYAAATTTTFLAGTGIDLIAVTANDDVIDGGEYAELTCWRQTDTDVTCLVSELVAAD